MNSGLTSVELFCVSGDGHTCGPKTHRTREQWKSTCELEKENVSVLFREQDTYVDRIGHSNQVT